MIRKDLHYLLHRYLAGECTSEEAELVEQWYELLDDDTLPPVAEEDIREIEARIWNKMHSPATVLPLYRKPVFKWSMAAAAILLLVAASVLWFSHQPGSADQFYSSLKNPQYIERVNNSQLPMTLYLEDSSQVRLNPGAAIKYPQHFTRTQRKVYLKGAAFFQVTKNAESPFYVFSEQVVTHVLGTSFYVTPSEGSNKVEVSVKTGRVEVYEQNNSRNSAAGNNGVILNANQKAIFYRQQERFEKTLVDNPLPLIQHTGQHAGTTPFVYTDALLEKVFADLGKAYGIEIITENEAVGQYTFTGDISQENLYKKLSLICRVTKLTYEIKGTTILIRNSNME